jgi:hypothetical protein
VSSGPPPGRCHPHHQAAAPALGEEARRAAAVEGEGGRVTPSGKAPAVKRATIALGRRGRRMPSGEDEAHRALDLWPPCVVPWRRRRRTRTMNKEVGHGERRRRRRPPLARSDRQGGWPQEPSGEGGDGRSET